LKKNQGNQISKNTGNEHKQSGSYPWINRVLGPTYTDLKNEIKIGHFKAIFHRSAPIDVKTGSSDPADFAITRLLIYWRVLAILAMAGATVGISRPLQRDMPID
jgi:hypothetical protein